MATATSGEYVTSIRHCPALISSVAVIWRWQLERKVRERGGGRMDRAHGSSSAADQYITVST